MRRARTLTCIGIAGVALAATWSALRAEGGRAPAKPELHATLREADGSPARPSEPAPSAPVARSDLAQPEAPATPPSPVKAQPSEAELLAQVADELEDKFHGEPLDRAWSVEMKTQIRTTVRDSLPSARVLEADCATSLCRVVLRHDSLEEQRKIGFVLASAGPFQHEVFYDYDATANPPTTTLYVAREGASLRTASSSL